MTEPTPTSPGDPVPDEPSRDPSNTPIEELKAPLDPADDARQRLALVNSSTEEDLRGADQ